MEGVRSEPHFHASRLHGSEAGKEDDDDDAVNAWNLRKCSTAGLDFLANAFGDDILPTLIPLVQENLSRTDDDAWKDREAAILCVGTIAEGCITGLYPHLPQIVSLLDDKFPLIRNITCQSLSRYSKFIVQTLDLPNGPEQFAMILMGLRRRILETNKRVQMAACSAFVALEKEAAEQGGLEIILQNLMCGYGKLQRRNLWLISDLLVALANAVGRKLNQAKYLDILIPPLIMKWQQLHISDKDIFPLVECFISITRAVGSGFSLFVEPVFQNCIILIKSQKSAKVDPAAAGALYYKEFIVLSLELLSGLAEALGAGIESLVAQSNLIDLLLQCCMDEAAGVRQSALALLGELSRVCHRHVHPHLKEFLNVAAKQLTWQSVKGAESVANNVCWVIGELAIKFREEISPVEMTMLSCLVPILRSPEGLNKILVENSVITLGRLSRVYPKTVALHMKRSMQAWCNALCMIRDDSEKEDAFLGLCAMVVEDPSRAVGSPAYVCQACASLNDVSENLRNEVCRILKILHQMLGSDGWEQCMSTLDASVLQRLARYEV